MNNQTQQHKILYWEFVALNGLLFAQNVMALDTFLPVLGLIFVDFQLAHITETQAFFTWCFLGFAFSQFLFAPLSDVFGRRRMLISACFLMGLSCLLVAVAQSFWFLLVARFMVGVGMGAGRTVNLSAMRDLYDGRDLGRAFSHVYMIFGVVPVFAPWIGYAFYDWGWRYAAAAPVIYAAILFVWMFLRYPETLPAEKRKKLSIINLAKNYGQVLSTRLTFFYSLATGLAFSSILLTLILSSQIGEDLFGVKWYGAALFSTIAVSISIISLLNAKLLQIFGMRGVGHVALLISLFSSLLLLGYVLSFDVQIWVLFTLLLMVIAPQAAVLTNFQAIAMVPHENMAGVGASVTGGVSTLVATLVSSFFGQFYSGGTTILAIGSVIPLSLSMLLLLYMWGGKLFGYQEKLKADA